MIPNAGSPVISLAARTCFHLNVIVRTGYTVDEYMEVAAYLVEIVRDSRIAEYLCVVR